MSLVQLWVDKYRPTLSEYVFTNESHKEIVESWIRDKSMGNVLLHGPQGVGKTELASILIKELGVNDYDVLMTNGSKEGRRIDWVDRTLVPFCETMPFGDFKICLIDEGDYLNPQSVQPSLRNLMEDYSDGVRFILTCNYPNRIIPPLHSRFQSLKVDKMDIVEYTARVATILVSENIEFDLDVLDTYVKAVYPDMRKCINNLQMNSLTGVLKLPESSESTADYRLEMTELFKQGKIPEARKLLCSQVRPEDIEEIFTWLYQNVELLGDTQKKQDDAVLWIKQAIVDHPSFADPEINLAALMIRLARNYNS